MTMLLIIMFVSFCCGRMSVQNLTVYIEDQNVEMCWRPATTRIATEFSLMILESLPLFGPLTFSFFFP